MSEEPNNQISSMYCSHANEVPNVCECYENCYCKSHTCSDRTKEPDKDLEERAKGCIVYDEEEGFYIDATVQKILRFVQELRNETDDSYYMKELNEYIDTDTVRNLMERLESERRHSDKLVNIVGKIIDHSYEWPINPRKYGHEFDPQVPGEGRLGEAGPGPIGEHGSRCPIRKLKEALESHIKRRSKENEGTPE